VTGNSYTKQECHVAEDKGLNLGSPCLVCLHKVYVASFLEYHFSLKERCVSESFTGLDY
jgi:hypothetical protein